MLLVWERDLAKLDEGMEAELVRDEKSQRVPQHVHSQWK